MNTVGGSGRGQFLLLNTENTLSYGISGRAALIFQYIALLVRSNDSVGFHSLSAVQRAHCWANLEG